MKRHIDFGEIKQFRNVVRNVQDSAQYIKTEDGIAIFDRNVKFPVIKAYATEKIHGTNAAVCYSNVDGFWVQGRNSIITTEKDHARPADIPSWPLDFVVVGCPDFFWR